MGRLGLRDKKGVNSLFTLIVGMVLLSGMMFAKSDFCASVQQICNAYQVAVDYDRMNLVEVGEGQEEFSMTMKSERNQFDRILIIGFYAAGKAMTYHQEPIQKVTVIISVAYKSTENIVASATRDNIVKFVNGELSTSEFIRRVKFD
jgi:hypothetical protein